MHSAKSILKRSFSILFVLAVLGGNILRADIGGFVDAQISTGESYQNPGV